MFDIRALMNEDYRRLAVTVSCGIIDLDLIRMRPRLQTVGK